MSINLGAIGGGVLGAGAGLLSGFGKSKAAEEASAKTHQAIKDWERNMSGLSDEIRGIGSDYQTDIQNQWRDFNPLDVEQAYNSLYESHIMPMMREFELTQLPAIDAAYSSGALGASSEFSGARAESEANARRDLSEYISGLRGQERDKEIARNYKDYDLRRNVSDALYNSRLMSPKVDMDIENRNLANILQDVGVNLSANQSKWDIPMTVLRGATNGANFGAGLSNLVKDNGANQNSIWDLLNFGNKE